MIMFYIIDSQGISEIVESNNKYTPIKQTLGTDISSLSKSKSQESQLDLNNSENTSDDILKNKQSSASNSNTLSADIKLEDIYIPAPSPLKSPRGSTSTDIDESTKSKIILIFFNF